MNRLGQLDPGSFSLDYSPSVPVVPTPTPDYNLANTIVSGLVSMTNSILGVVRAGQAGAASAPTAPAYTGPQIFAPGPAGMSTAGMIAIGLPIAVVAMLMVTRKGGA